MRALLLLLGILGVCYAALIGFVAVRQRTLLFFPSHERAGALLEPWVVAGRTLGFCHEVPQPRTVWLMTHGNAGQASARGYVLPHLDAADALYVLEYPGYGARPGAPTRESMNAAAAEAYRALRAAFPGTPVGVVGESIGTGPACFLAAAAPPPDKLVLLVPFDALADVAAEHLPFFPVRLMLRDAWDNGAALRSYGGPVDLFAAADDHVIPVRHARKLAASIPQARLVVIPGGHNDWADQPQVRIAR